MTPAEFRPIIYMTRDRLARVSRVGILWHADVREHALDPWRQAGEDQITAEDAMVCAIRALGLEEDEADPYDYADEELPF